MSTPPDVQTAFIKAACVPQDASHSSGTLDSANAILVAHSDVAASSIHTAAILGDDILVRRFLASDPGNATAQGGPYNWDALTHLCFSRYLRLDDARADGFLRAAEALLDAGAGANTGWMEKNHQPEPEWESVLYGAAGIAHNPGLTRLLLERGANPSDNETVYHAPESYDNRALQIIVETGKLTDSDLALMLIRKHDWHDEEGVRWLLEHGVDPNQPWSHGEMSRAPLHHAIERDNSLAIFELLLEHGANPTIVSENQTGVQRAARAGRGDLLELFERHGFAIDLHGPDKLIAACALSDTKAIRAIAAAEPQLVEEIVANGGRLLAEFAGVGNTDGVRNLLDLGVDVAALFKDGDGYYDVAKNSMAIHVAAWRAQHSTLKLLIECGSPVDVQDGKGRTPLALAVRACTDSYWMSRRSPDSVEALLKAGASPRSVATPTGYPEIDKLLEAARL